MSIALPCHSKGDLQLISAKTGWNKFKGQPIFRAGSIDLEG